MNGRVWILAALLALLPAGAVAEDLHYTYVQSAWVSVDPDAGESGSGPSVDFAYGFNRLLHMVGQYSDIDFDPVDATTWGVGAGVHKSMGAGFDIVGEASYIETEIDVPLFGSISEDGYQLNAGVRTLLTQAFELNGGIEHTDFGNAGDDTAFNVKALWNVNPRFAVGGGYEIGDDADTLFLGFRVNFGRRQ